MEKRANRIIDHASREANFALEKTAREAELVVRNAARIMADERDVTLDRISVQNQNALAVLENVIDELEQAERIYIPISDLVALDLQNLINQLPFKKDVYLFRRLEGYALVHKENGSYLLSATGGAFKDGFEPRIEIGSHTIPRIQVRRTTPYRVDFDIPSQELSNSFKDDQVVRLPISIEAIRSADGRIAMSFNGKILLLPLRPISYKLVAHLKTERWEDVPEPIYHKVTVPGPNKRTEHSYAEVKVTVPRDCRIIPAKTKWGKEDDMAWFAWIPPNVQYDSQLQMAWIRADTWWETFPRNVWMKVWYQKRVAESRSETVEITDSPNRLAFGTAFATFDASTYQSYTLELSTFTGDEYVLSPTKPNCALAQATVESMSSFVRLRLDVVNPFPQ